MTHTITIADLFCGAGGTSTGALQAIRSAGHKAKLTAVNHWPVAVKTHEANHPEARHLCASLDSLNPRDLFREGELDILWGSPECTHHSVARGGRPMNDQSRATAWCIVRWAEALLPRCIYVENVPEFQGWGPIGSNGRPLASRKGETFRAWLGALESLGYKLDYREMCVADYGDPTTRVRLIVQAVRGRSPIVWPEPTHTQGETLFGTARWRQAAEIIDWSLKGGLLSERKRPLCKNTMDRIMAGIRRFGGQPFVVAWDQQSAKSSERSVTDPLSTITTKARHGLVEPFLVQVNHQGGDRVRSVKEPMPTICGNRGEWGLVEPFIVELRGTGKDQVENSTRSIREPLSTIAASGTHHALCEPFVVEYYGNGEPRPTSQPLPTITTRDRFGLVEPVRIGARVDARFRMLQPHELAGAQGFPKDYQFAGTKSDVVKQIGNAVPPGLARALVAARLATWFKTKDAA